MIDANAKMTYYWASSNDPPGDKCAYTGRCVPYGAGKVASAAHGRGSPYAKGGLYTVAGRGLSPFCVRIDDICAACRGTWLDVFMPQGKRLPFESASVSQGC